jgi:uncharacterized SAM-binding protein YcdF (DUF218 family)
VSATRLVAVCGYSDGGGEGLHAICERRLRRAEQEAGPSDVVLLSGWARGSDAAPEAELMAQSWNGHCRRLYIDRSARSTFGNVAAAAALARSVNAQEVILVTSSWHARRAGALLRSALSGTGTRIDVATTDESPTLVTRLRETACWASVPVAALRARKNSSSPSGGLSAA